MWEPQWCVCDEGEGEEGEEVEGFDGDVTNDDEMAFWFQ